MNKLIYQLYVSALKEFANQKNITEERACTYLFYSIDFINILKWVKENKEMINIQSFGAL